MKKIYRLTELDCANCARKMEDLIMKIDGVNVCKIGFMTQKLTLDIDDNKLDEVMPQIKKAINTVDKNTQIINR